MTAVPAEPSAREKDIARRWDHTAGQVAQTVDTVRGRRLSLANTADEIDITPAGFARGSRSKLAPAFLLAFTRPEKEDFLI